MASQSPHKRTMIVVGNGDIGSAISDDGMPPLEDCSDVDVTEPVNGDSLVNMRILNVQPKTDVGEERRDNISPHTLPCHIKDKVYIPTIDGGSRTNVVSTLLITTLNLKTSKHPKTRKLRWLNDCGEIGVAKRDKIAFATGKYHDGVLCEM